MITFEVIKQKANLISDAMGTDSFLDVFDSEMNTRELIPADISAVAELAEVYNRAKVKEMSRDEAAEKQKELYEAWRKERF